MEERKTVFDYLAQALILFGLTTAILNVFCLLFGESAKDLSAMFALGNQGLPTEICFQFLVVSFLIAGMRILFFTDVLIKNMAIWLRTLCMLASVILIIAVFAVTFHWFPAGMWQPWAMFFICFGISFLASYLVMAIKEKTDNKKMEDALKRLKKKEGRP